MRSQFNSGDRDHGRPTQTDDSSENLEESRDPAYDEPEGKSPSPPPPEPTSSPSPPSGKEG